MMTMCEVRLTDSAVKDIQQISDFYLSVVNKASIDKTLNDLQSAFALISAQPEIGKNHPLIGPHLGNIYRQYMCKPFKLLYKIQINDAKQKSIIIVMLLHEKQSLQKALANRLLY